MSDLQRRMTDLERFATYFADTHGGNIVQALAELDVIRGILFASPMFDRESFERAVLVRRTQLEQEYARNIDEGLGCSPLIER